MKLVVSKDLQPTIPDDKESSSPMATRRLAPPKVQPTFTEVLAIYTIKDRKIARLDFVK